MKIESLSNTGEEVRNGVGKVVGGGMGLRESQVARLLVGAGEVDAALVSAPVTTGLKGWRGTSVCIGDDWWSSPTDTFLRLFDAGPPPPVAFLIGRLVVETADDGGAYASEDDDDDEAEDGDDGVPVSLMMHDVDVF